MNKARKKEVLLCDYYDEWVDVYKEGAVRDVTLTKYRNTAKVLRTLVPKLFVSDLDRRSYQSLLNEYALTHEKQTTTDFHHQVKACIKDMFHDGLLDKDPTYRAIIKGKVASKKKQKFMQTEELKKLLQSLDLISGINRDWFILIIAKTGIRFAEALALTPNDFDFENHLLSVEKTWDYKRTSGGFQKTKTNTSTRKISIDWQIVGQFRPLIQNLEPDEPIFIEKLVDGRYKRTFNSTINNYMSVKCKNLGITEITIHALRHTHASVLLAGGVSINTISSRLGHANIGITQEVYAHVLDELKAADDQKVMSTMMQIA